MRAKEDQLWITEGVAVDEAQLEDMLTEVLLSTIRQAPSYSRFVILAPTAQEEQRLRAAIINDLPPSRFDLIRTKDQAGTVRDINTLLQAGGGYSPIWSENPKPVVKSRLGYCPDTNALSENEHRTGDRSIPTQNDIEKLCSFARQHGATMLMVPEIAREAGGVQDRAGKFLNRLEQASSCRRFEITDWGDQLPSVRDTTGTVATHGGDLIIMAQLSSILNGPDFENILVISSDIRMASILTVVRVRGYRRFLVISPQEANSRVESASTSFGSIMAL